MNNKVPFQISARLMSHLGEALISDELVALLELIKNAYDADANKAKIIIDTNYINEFGIGKISISDDGHGMDYDVITNAFLKLATDYKIKSQKISPKYKRLSLGNKGVGRLSLQRLGSYARITTNNGSKEYSFVIDWTLFEEDVDLQQILISIDENEKLSLPKQGTLIEIYGLKNIELWKNKNTFTRFKREILSIINPYISNETRFSIFFELDEFRFASDKYDINLIETLADSIVNYEFISETKKLFINIKRKVKYADHRMDESFKRYEKMGFSYEELDKNARYSFLEDSYTIDLCNISKSYSKIQNDILLKDDTNQPYLPGDFKGSYFAFDKSASRFTHEDKNFLDLINGVKLFRNNFRILPYGDDDYEWLNFTKYSQTYSGNIYRGHSVAGYIYIDGEENLDKLTEMTNRQGLIEDSYGKNFLIILREIISLIIVSSDIKFRSDFIPNYDKIKNAKDNEVVTIFSGKVIFKKNPSLIKKIKESTTHLSDNIQPSVFDTDEISQYKHDISKYATTIDKGIHKIADELEAEKNKLEEEFQLLEKYKIVMASAIVAESLSHEILKLAQKTKDYALNIRKEISKKSLDTNNINVNLEMIVSNMQFLFRNASILDSNSYVKRNTFEVVNVKEFLNDLFNIFPFFDNCIEHHLSYSIIGEGFNYNLIKNNFIITIENLIVNSKYWLDKNEIKNPSIIVELQEKQIIFYDNGLGISHDVEDTLFEAFVSCKPNFEGRGLGLYIVKQLLNEIGASIQLLKERNKYGNCFKFLISFQ